MLHVETGATVQADPCPCCGKERRASFGFVHDDEDTVAFYYAALAPEGHRERSVTVAVSLGDWGHEVDPSTRHAAVLRALSVRGEIEIAFLESAESPVRDRAALGPILSRDEAVRSVTRDRFVEIAGALLLEDAEVNDYIAS